MHILAQGQDHREEVDCAVRIIVYFRLRYCSLVNVSSGKISHFTFQHGPFSSWTSNNRFSSLLHLHNRIIYRRFPLVYSPILMMVSEEPLPVRHRLPQFFKIFI